MKNNYVKILSVLFACTLLLAGCSNSGEVGKSTTATPNNPKATAESTDWDKIPDSDFGYEYNSELKGVEIYYKGSNASNLRFPDTINGDPVVAIVASESRTPASIKAVYIPKSVKVIGAGAFSGYYKLPSITIPDSVTEIGDSAFHSCRSLTSVTIPDSVAIIGDNAFTQCSALTKITIPDSVTSIGSGAFNACEKLANITLPATVDKIDIGPNAFEYTYWYNKQPDGIIRIGNTVLCYKGENQVTITIPDGVACISDGAFSNGNGKWDKLTSVTIPNSVTKIGDATFRGCSSLDEATKSRIRQINPNSRFE